MIRLTPRSLIGRKEQLTFIINLIFIIVGVVFIIHDYFFDFRVDGYWSAGSLREVELIVCGALVIGLLQLKWVGTAKFITSISLILVFFVSPLIIKVNYLEMYYINTLLLPAIVLIPSMVFRAKEDRTLILALFVAGILTNFAFEQIIFRFKEVSPADLEFYHYHFILFSLAKIFTSLFIYVNITRLFQQNEMFEEKIEEQNEALRKTGIELKNLDVAKSHFFANISHEFRTPLTLLMGPLGEQIDKSIHPVEKERFIVMKRSATRLLNLVNQLLDLSKLESGSLTLQAARQELVAFLRYLTSQFESIAESRHIEFRFEASSEVYLWFDGDKLEKIVSNVVANALKFTPAGGIVSLVIRKTGDESDPAGGFVEIEVSDSGIGIEADKVERIFDRFYQVSDSSRREYEGTGIGLALTKELVELHGGSIRVFSSPEQGSIFTIRLPLGRKHLGSEEIVESPSRYQANGNDPEGQAIVNGKPDLTRPHSDELPLVLVVEDNADLQRYLAESLGADYRISFAANGQEGIDTGLAELPDLIISDLMMPKVDGMELVRQLKTDERTSHIPIILLTAKADSGTKLEGIETGADDYVAKPFEMAELKARIQNLIDSRRLLREKFSVARVIRATEMKVESVDDQFLKKVLMSIEEHIADDVFGVSELAQDVAMSTVQLYRKVKALTGKTPIDLIKSMRLDRAKSLLDQQAGNVSEIAVKVGFRNMSYFAKSFKEKFGVNPSEL